MNYQSILSNFVVNGYLQIGSRVSLEKRLPDLVTTRRVQVALGMSYIERDHLQD